MSADAASPHNPTELRQVMVGLGLAMLLSALDQTIVVTALPTIAAELGDAQDLPWIVTAYLVAATVVTPLYGKFADVYGRRVVILVGVATFILGSVACALAPSMSALALARVVQGLGGGGLISLGQTIVADLVSPARAWPLSILFRRRLHHFQHRRSGARRLFRAILALVA